MPENLELERQVFHLQTLYEVANALNHCRDSGQIYKETLSILAGTFGVEYGFALQAANHAKWQLVSERGFNESLAADLENHVLGGNFPSRKTATKESLLLEFLAKTYGDEFAANACVWTEFFGRDQALGGLFLGGKLSGAPFSESDHELLDAVAGHVAIRLENLALYEDLHEAQERLQLENITLREDLLKDYEDGRIVGQSEAIGKLLQQAKNVARSPTNVLICGETGTGKELVAKTIHYSSPRKDRAFVAVNCTAIPENLVESELFGIEAGVATGVKKHIGYFEQADGGTLFIDEIGDMPLSSQAKILRVLQERRLRRVGGTKEISVDVRVVVATNKNLEEEMQAGNFREDLYYRLSVLELHLPPLRHRREDIPLLVTHFAQELEGKIKTRIKGFSKLAMKLLTEHDWPGNVRELENEVERALTLSAEGAVIQPEDLSGRINRGATKLDLPGALQAETLREAVDALEKHLIDEALTKYNWNKSEVSRRLGLSRLGLQKKIDRLGVHPREIR